MTYQEHGKKTDSASGSHECVPGGEFQRSAAFKMGINIIVYSLTSDYKKDVIHHPFIHEASELMTPGSDNDCAHLSFVADSSSLRPWFGIGHPTVLPYSQKTRTFEGIDHLYPSSGCDSFFLSPLP